MLSCLRAKEGRPAWRGSDVGGVASAPGRGIFRAVDSLELGKRGTWGLSNSLVLECRVVAISCVVIPIRVLAKIHY